MCDDKEIDRSNERTPKAMGKETWEAKATTAVSRHRRPAPFPFLSNRRVTHNASPPQSPRPQPHTSLSSSTPLPSEQPQPPGDGVDGWDRRRPHRQHGAGPWLHFRAPCISHQVRGQAQRRGLGLQGPPAINGGVCVWGGDVICRHAIALRRRPSVYRDAERTGSAARRTAAR